MINVKEIPEESMMWLVRSLHRGAKRFYQDPENRKAYEKWAAERKEAATNAAKA